VTSVVEIRLVAGHEHGEDMLAAVRERLQPDEIAQVGEGRWQLTFVRPERSAAEVRDALDTVDDPPWTSEVVVPDRPH
jgi:hypothetical protein